MEKPSRMRARRLWIFLNPLLAEGGEAVASVPPDLMSRTYSGFFSVGRNRFFATADHAPSCAVLTQECCVKSCCATRLKASAATVLSSRGAVIPHVQREQHQPVKSSPSIQISFRLIHLPLRACLGLELGLRLVGINWVHPSPSGNLPRNPRAAKCRKWPVALGRKTTGGDVRMPTFIL